MKPCLRTLLLLWILLALPPSVANAQNRSKPFPFPVPTPLPPASLAIKLNPLTLYSPQNYQVFQRRTRLRGEVDVKGTVRVPCDRVEVRLTGKSLLGSLPSTWQKVALRSDKRAFQARLPAAAGGWYRLELRALQQGKVVAQEAIAHVGVGEVFVGAGQSNSTNWGEGRTTQNSGMVASFSGTTWQLSKDPQPGTHDKSVGGSFWPTFGDALYARYHVPIGVSPTGNGGTSVWQWQKDADLYQWLLIRLRKLGKNGFRAILWHQGETDAMYPLDNYEARLTSAIRATRQAAGWQIPWFVAQTSYLDSFRTRDEAIRAAQKHLWEKGIALEGPDTDTLGSRYREMAGTGIHFSIEGLRAHGKLWAQKVSVYLDRVLR